MAVFVNFMFSNAIFTHVHKGIDGRQIAHSHPYLPSSGHNHTGQSIDLVAGFNAAAQAAVAAVVAAVETPVSIYTTVTTEECSYLLCAHNVVKNLRAPPAAKY